ncbi:MAG TPA: hypothetical protein VFV38_16720 [Ktedonobacteraceae bacterium]|nr:hypothetical protein [Ktedonobacteraceae bacterium]
MPVYQFSRFRAPTLWRNLPGRCVWLLMTMLVLLLSACSGLDTITTGGTPTTGGGSGKPGGFPTSAPALRVPQFSSGEQIASTVKVLSSLDPTLIVQFPLFPSGIKKLYPDASGLVTVIQGNPEVSVFDTVTVDVQKMPPNQKFTIFFTELSAKPFGHAQYVGDMFTRGDGSGESVVHLIAFVAFAADNRNPGTSADQSGDASGIQLEHVGLWFDGVGAARRVLGDPTIAGTPFDGGGGVAHAGPQALTDGQTLPVI